MSATTPQENSIEWNAVKPTTPQLDAAVVTYNKHREKHTHEEALCFMIQPHSKTKLTTSQLIEAADAYASKRDPERWDGPPWGLAGQANHRAGIRAALESLP